jgi:hypothetical protein
MGRLTLHREWVDLAEDIDTALMVVRPLLEKKGLNLQVTVPRDLPRLYCDKTRIRQVILNLVSNAARYTEKGGIPLRASQQDQVNLAQTIQELHDCPAHTVIINTAAASTFDSLVEQARQEIPDTPIIGCSLPLDGRQLLREFFAGSSYLAPEDPRLHFGLGQAEVVSRLEIRWPNGQTVILAQVPVNQMVRICWESQAQRLNPAGCDMLN